MPRHPCQTADPSRSGGKIATLDTATRRIVPRFHHVVHLSVASQRLKSPTVRTFVGPVAQRHPCGSQVGMQRCYTTSPRCHRHPSIVPCRRVDGPISVQMGLGHYHDAVGRIPNASRGSWPTDMWQTGWILLRYDAIMPGAYRGPRRGDTWYQEQ